MATAKTLIDRESAGAAAHNLSGTALLAMGRIEEARSAFHKALEVDGQFVTALHNLAKIDLHDDNPEQAAKRFEEALNRVPDDVSSMVELAKPARRKSDLEGAINWLEKARAIDAKALSPQLDLIELYLLTGRMDQAKRLTDSPRGQVPRQSRGPRRQGSGRTRHRQRAQGDGHLPPALGDQRGLGRTTVQDRQVPSRDQRRHRRA